MTGSQKSLGKGSPAPGPVPEGSVRLYSMRFCPYAQRARLVLLAKGIKHEVVNINLKNKPDWFFEKNPLGLVPAVELSDGEVIYESPIVCDFLDEAYPGKKLTPADPIKKAKQKIILEFFSGVTTAHYKLFLAKKENQDATEQKAELLTKLQKLEEFLVKNKTAYFGGESVSMIDYMIYPWFERFPLFDVINILTQTPELKKWYDLMLQDSAVKETITAPDVLLGFYKLYAQNSIDAVDYGL
ncbi:glutathione S-transferase omega-1-like [Pelobates cultripes]|uniref:Glutathione S-transferase omega n=1 Tax=Pelobates cultripes TaxID=61616 RepID=A0AAD1TD63_PELCU|nr:glutathione S-transferase omega-1-like [Pelobates cultripes]CAH2322427.1 glutathione S-transferase omega-1-like [Pelobates cultripes]